MYDPSCIFCKIASRGIPADVLHATETVVAFRDTNPKAPVHIVIIPKDHIDSIAGIADGHGRVLTDMFHAANHLAKTEGIDDSGYRVVTNVGSDGGQTVFHLHFHLLGGRPMTWPPG
jgi:histidine triad (HIT) family protein